MDIFIEKLVKKQRTSKDMLKAIGLIVLSLVIVFFIIPLIPFVKGFLIFFIVAIPFFAYYVIKSQNIEY
ncbi:MAG: hypothetical protein QJR05_10950 [Thermoanaerobacterium sp.]|nr:hypothetical protein [Thermoanaerobacterium sp.]